MDQKEEQEHGVFVVELPGDYRVEVPGKAPGRVVTRCIERDETFGLNFPAAGGAFGAVRRSGLSRIEEQRALRCDVIAERVAETTLEAARRKFKRETGKAIIPEESFFEALYKLPGLPACRVIVGYAEGEPLGLVKMYPDLRPGKGQKRRLVYVFVGNAGPFDIID